MRKPVVLITGGSGGIGEAIVWLFAQNGYRVVFQYHKNEEKAKTLLSALRERGYEAVCVQSDLDSIAAAKQIVNTAHLNFGAVDVLIHSAGIAQQKLFLDLTEADWKRMLSVNLDSAFYLTKAVLPDMLAEHSGNIIYLSSMWGQVGASMEVHYSASKAGLIGLTKSLAKELGPNGIRVNCVAPGVIDTPMNAMLGEETIAMLAEETPLGIIGTPQDVAKTCLFLAEDSGRFFTGQVLALNGGMVI